MAMGEWGAGGVYDFGGGAFVHRSMGRGFSRRLFGAGWRCFGRWWKVELECGGEGEGEDVVLGKLWGVKLKRWNFNGGFVL